MVFVQFLARTQTGYAPPEPGEGRSPWNASCASSNAASQHRVRLEIILVVAIIAVGRHGYYLVMKAGSAPSS